MSNAALRLGSQAEKGIGKMDKLKDKVMGCIIGATIGDSIGAVFEFRPKEFVLKHLGGRDWVDEMYEFVEMGTHPMGLWRANPPGGTGTDDTRLMHIFIDCLVKNKGRINSQLLAMEYVDRWTRLEEIYPTEYHDLARRQLRAYTQSSAAHLGMSEFGDLQVAPAYRVSMRKAPHLWGLLTCQPAGLLCGASPEEAYLAAAEIDYFDIGYARDATAMLAAIVAAALGDEAGSAREVLQAGIETNPFGIESRPLLSEGTWLYPDEPSITRWLRIADEARSEREAMIDLARSAASVHPFNCLDILGVAIACTHFCKGDVRGSILMAANHRRVDEKGELVQMRDIDCTAMMAGVIVGAINGLSAFPKEWVEKAVAANKEVYGFDIMENAEAFYRAVYG